MFKVVGNIAKRAFLVAPLVLLGALSLILLGQNNVSAVSAYDNVFWHQTTVWLPVYDSNTSTYTYKDVGSNWDNLILNGSAKSSFEDARDNGGHWMVVNGNDSLSIIWSADTSVKTSFFTKYGQPSWGISSGNQWNVIRLYEQSGVLHQSHFLNQTVDNVQLFGEKPDPLPASPGGVVFSTYENIYPDGYEGQLIVGLNDDIDGDGLDAADEYLQGTSNFKVDTDGDGLSDYIESQWNPGRNDIFCGTSCAYPNPAQKDLYVEIDWMKEPSVSGRSFEPNATRIEAMEDAFAAKGIDAHFDTGEYGGGNELTTYAHDLYMTSNPAETDFYDIKATNFATDRHRIWHYMISGYGYHEDTESSGAAYPGDDDIFISSGTIMDGQSDFHYTDLDTALAGTMIHEIGHNICLNSSPYVGQSTACLYDKIDTVAGSLYDSAMNYDVQMFKVDYSSGLNGTPDDHDDWSAVLDGGLDDFADTTRSVGDPSSGASRKREDTKANRLVRGITKNEAKQRHLQGKLGGKHRKYTLPIR